MQTFCESCVYFDFTHSSIHPSIHPHDSEICYSKSSYLTHLVVILWFFKCGPGWVSDGSDGGVNKNWYLADALEGSFKLNPASYVSCQLSGGSHLAVGYIQSVSIALTTFIGIHVCHIKFVSD